MDIIKKEIYACPLCGNFRGWIKEKDNSWVMAVCACDLEKFSLEYRCPNPVMIAPGEDRIYWKPISDFRGEDGRWIHVAHFAGPVLRKKVPGLDVVDYKKTENDKLLKMKNALAEIKEKYPLVPHTQAGRLYSTVRRMKAEKEAGIPIPLRAGAAISTETGKHADEMSEPEWEKFYKDLAEELNRYFPELYLKLFPKE